MFSRSCWRKIGLLSGTAAAATLSISSQFENWPSFSAWRPKVAQALSPDPTKNDPSQYAKWDYNWDRREPISLLRGSELKKLEKEGPDAMSKALDSKTASAKRHILMVRHGQFYFAGLHHDDDHVLTDLGVKQAISAGMHLAEKNYVFDRVVHSPQTRARQTWENIHKGLNPKNIKAIESDVLIAEGVPCLTDPPLPYEVFEKLASSGGLEVQGGQDGRSDLVEPETNDQAKPNREPFGGFVGVGDLVMPAQNFCTNDLRQNMEKWSKQVEHMDYARMEAGFRKHIHRADPGQKQDSYELFVCHANLIRYFVVRALQLPPSSWFRFDKSHCSITWLTVYPNGTVKMKTFGDVGHLPSDMVTTLNL